MAGPRKPGTRHGSFARQVVRDNAAADHHLVAVMPASDGQRDDVGPDENAVLEHDLRRTPHLEVVPAGERHAIADEQIVDGGGRQQGGVGTGPASVVKDPGQPNVTGTPRSPVTRSRTCSR